ncbi:unnamed protein product [Rotaria sp. Silwood1]|nr:unnamed protein product [Rotaria sp. Silwood1]
MKLNLILILIQNTHVEDIDLNDFIKCKRTFSFIFLNNILINLFIYLFLLYINHLPAFGLNPADLNQAFNGLSDQLNPDNNQPQITRENLLFLLQQYGEHMNDYEMADCLGNLLH